jgi:uncharacterized protein YjdB
MSTHSLSTRLMMALFTASLIACGSDSSTETRAAVALVRVTPDSRELFIGGTLALSARVEDAGGRALQGRTVTWSSSSDAIASVSSAGVVTAHAPGVAQITATSEQKSGAATITVTASPAPVYEIALSAGGATIVEGDSRTLTVKLWDAQGNELFGRAVTWSTDNQNIGVVSASGVLEAKSPGPLVITVSSEGKSNSLGITVLPNQAPVASVSLDVESL